MLRVLVVEDNAVNQRVLTMQLERAGHRAHLAANGLAALAAVEQQPFDLVLMDLQMPEMDGVRTTRLLRARERATGGRVAVVAVTASTLPGERQRCLAAGMDDYLTKPVRAADLYATIDRVLERKPASMIEESGPTMALGSPHLQPLVQTFLEEVPGRMDRLRDALAEVDAPAVNAAAHALKGMLMIFSARAAVEAARSLEEQGFRQQFEGAVEPLAVLESEVGTLVEQMKAFLQKSSS